MSHHSSPADNDAAPVYQIRIKGHLGREWSDWFGGLSVSRQANGDTLLTGPVIDQAALHGLLRSVRDLGLPLLALARLDPEQPGTPDEPQRNAPMTSTSTPFAQPSPTPARSGGADWLTPAGLILLSAVPFIAGVSRVAGLATGVKVTPENARFVATPLPVILHIIAATLFCILGAFQFSAGFRRRRPGWHRRVGRALVGCGLVAGLSGLWMTQFYPLYPSIQNSLLYAFRMVFGWGMVGSIALSLAAIWRRDIAAHRAWIIRGYALGQGAGTQVFTFLAWQLAVGTPGWLAKELLMGAGWVINLALAEWIIRRERRPARKPAAGETLKTQTQG